MRTPDHSRSARDVDLGRDERKRSARTMLGAIAIGIPISCCTCGWKDGHSTYSPRPGM